MLNIKRFDLDDLDKFEPKGSFEDLERDLGAAFVEDRFQLWTIRNHDLETISVFGFRRMGPGIAELFSIASKNVSKYKLDYVKRMRSVVKSFPTAYGLHKVIFTVEEQEEWAHKWARLLGFEKEGYLKGYDGLGNNHHLFGRVV